MAAGEGDGAVGLGPAGLGTYTGAWACRGAVVGGVVVVWGGVVVLVPAGVGT